MSNSTRDTEKKVNESIDKTANKTASAARDTEKKVNDTIHNTANAAQDEVSKMRKELDDLRQKAGPKVKEAETFLTSPTAIGFYQGAIFGVVLVLGYAKYNGGIRL